jgi:hypothetical protein
MEPDRMKLIAEIGCNSERIEMSADMATLEQVLETIERFIRASGYCPDGQLTFLKEDL